MQNKCCFFFGFSSAYFGLLTLDSKAEAEIMRIWRVENKNLLLSLQASWLTPPVLLHDDMKLSKSHVTLLSCINLLCFL